MGSGSNRASPRTSTGLRLSTTRDPPDLGRARISTAVAERSRGIRVMLDLSPTHVGSTCVVARRPTLRLGRRGTQQLGVPHRRWRRGRTTTAQPVLPPQLRPAASGPDWWNRTFARSSRDSVASGSTGASRVPHRRRAGDREGPRDAGRRSFRVEESSASRDVQAETHGSPRMRHSPRLRAAAFFRRGVKTARRRTVAGIRCGDERASLCRHAHARGLDADEMRGIVAEIEAALRPCLDVLEGSNTTSVASRRGAGGDDARRQMRTHAPPDLRGTPCLYGTARATEGEVPADRVVDCAAPSRTRAGRRGPGTLRGWDIVASADGHISQRGKAAGDPSSTLQFTTDLIALRRRPMARTERLGRSLRREVPGRGDAAGDVA